MISIVIPAYNEEARIGSCLLSLCLQETSEPFEVIVADNASTDATREIAESFNQRLNIKVISVQTPGRGNARFFGFKKAQGEIVLSLDADIIVPTNWVESYRRLFENSNVHAATGPYYIRDSSWYINAVYNLWVPFFAYISPWFIGTVSLRGGNFAIRKRAYMHAGQFDPNVDLHDDVELSFRVSKHYKILFAQNISVETCGRRLSKGIFRGAMEYVIGFFSMFVLGKRHIRLSNAR